MHNELMTIKDNIRVHNACADPKKKIKEGGVFRWLFEFARGSETYFGNFLMFI